METLVYGISDRDCSQNVETNAGISDGAFLFILFLYQRQGRFYIRPRGDNKGSKALSARQSYTPAITYI